MTMRVLRYQGKATKKEKLWKLQLLNIGEVAKILKRNLNADIVKNAGTHKWMIMSSELSDLQCLEDDHLNTKVLPLHMPPKNKILILDCIRENNIITILTMEVQDYKQPRISRVRQEKK